MSTSKVYQGRKDYFIENQVFQFLLLRTIFKINRCFKHNFHLKHSQIIAAIATVTTSNANRVGVSVMLLLMWVVLCPGFLLQW